MLNSRLFVPGQCVHGTAVIPHVTYIFFKRPCHQIFFSHTYAFNYESIQEFIVYILYAVLVNVAELYIDYKVPKIRITKHR